MLILSLSLFYLAWWIWRMRVVLQIYRTSKAGAVTQQIKPIDVMFMATPAGDAIFIMCFMAVAGHMACDFVDWLSEKV